MSKSKRNNTRLLFAADLCVRARLARATRCWNDPAYARRVKRFLRTRKTA